MKNIDLKNKKLCSRDLALIMLSSTVQSCSRKIPVRLLCCLEL